MAFLLSQRYCSTDLNFEILQTAFICFALIIVYIFFGRILKMNFYVKLDNFFLICLCMTIRNYVVNKLYWTFYMHALIKIASIFTIQFILTS